jgi:hypothetical protein
MAEKFQKSSSNSPNGGDGPVTSNGNTVITPVDKDTKKKKECCQ